MKHFPIDAVITWVDGNDPKWQKKINQFREIKIDFKKKSESVRYNSIGEIDIAITSIIKYAPFIRNIFLVTDNQKPKSFDQLQNLASKNDIHLECVDHKIIFEGFEDCLPCFNSCSIGSMLFRIPNLAEHFIVFNDDTFLMRTTSPSDFFIDNTPIVRGKWVRFNEYRTLRKVYHSFLSKIGKSKPKTEIGFKNFQQRSAKLAGAKKKYIRRFHTPVSIRKSTLERFFKVHELLKDNVQHRFRNKNQFIISSLSEHLEVVNQSFTYRNRTQLTYFRSYKFPLLVRLKLFLFEFLKDKRFMTFQSLELADDKTLNYILKWITKKMV
jgi:hypothetical protein